MSRASDLLSQPWSKCLWRPETSLERAIPESLGHRQGVGGTVGDFGFEPGRRRLHTCTYLVRTSSAMGRPEGSIATALKNTRVITASLVVIIAVSAVLIGLGKLTTGWTVAAQIVSAIAGAALGNFLRLDMSQHVVRNQAKPATRHLFDRVTRLRAMVVRSERYHAQVKELAELDVALDHDRIGDWFGFLGEGLRSEINATASAIEDWGDLAKDVVDSEIESYNSRNDRLPTQESEQDEG